MENRDVLWVDDDPHEIFSSLIKKIRKQGHTLTWAESINDCVQKMIDTPYDLLILDQTMPFKNMPGNTLGGTEWAGCFLLYWLGEESEAWQKECSRLSGINWDELPKDFREAKPKAKPKKIIICSAIDVPEIRQRIEAVDPEVVFIAKPINRKLLISEIETI
jgi:CheY-like chemotaxis protein